MQPEFLNGPPPANTAHNLELVRTPATKTLTGICLSDDLTTTRTHYCGNRTNPHTTPDCPHCDNMIPFRYHSYLAMWSPSTRTRYLFEMCQEPALALELERTRYGTLRGLRLTMFRASKKPNGRITIHADPGEIAPADLPTCPNVRRALAVIWHLPFDSVDNDPNASGRAIAEIDSRPGTQKITRERTAAEERAASNPPSAMGDLIPAIPEATPDDDLTSNKQTIRETHKKNGQTRSR